MTLAILDHQIKVDAHSLKSTSILLFCISYEMFRHHLKIYGILGEGCFGQVWKCEALNIDGVKVRMKQFIFLFYINFTFYSFIHLNPSTPGLP